MSIQAAREELKSLTDFQREMHVQSDDTDGLISNFYKVFIKSTWYSSVLMKLKSSLDGDEIVYQVNNTFHLLMYTYMRFMLPAIRVRPEFKGRVRISWCHNAGTNHIQQAVFKEDDDVYQRWDNVWADIYFQFFQSSGAGKRDSHNVSIGNVKCLEEWSEFLPSYPINVDQPWFYAMDTALAFPIFYKNSQTRAEHRYNLHRNITHLLRCQILTKDEKWRDVNRSFHKYLDIDQNASLKIPELWGRYAYISENEIKWYKECGSAKERVFYTRDVEICEVPNPNKYRSTAEIPLHCKNPCLAFFWVAENKDASDYHNYSNYTTNTTNLYQGWDPIKSVTLKYGTIPVIDNMPSDHFSIAEPRKHFPSAPNECGYHGYSFASDSTNFHGDISIVLGKMNARLQCKISNNNIFTSTSTYEEEEDDEDSDIAQSGIDDISGESVKHSGDFRSSKILDIQNDETSPSFITRARLLVIRKFTINPDTTEKDKYKFNIL